MKLAFCNFCVCGILLCSAGWHDCLHGCVIVYVYRIMSLCTHTWLCYVYRIVSLSMCTGLFLCLLVPDFVIVYMYRIMSLFTCTRLCHCLCVPDYFIVCMYRIMSLLYVPDYVIVICTGLYHCYMYRIMSLLYVPGCVIVICTGLCHCLRTRFCYCLCYVNISYVSGDVIGYLPNFVIICWIVSLFIYSVFIIACEDMLWIAFCGHVMGCVRRGLVVVVISPHQSPCDGVCGKRFGCCC